MSEYGIEKAAEAFVKNLAPIESGTAFGGSWTGTIEWSGTRAASHEAVIWPSLSIPGVIEGLVDHFAKRLGCTREAVVAGLVEDIKSGNLAFGKGEGWGKAVRESLADQCVQVREGKTSIKCRVTTGG
jgi:hypothetical protein